MDTRNTLWEGLRADARQADVLIEEQLRDLEQLANIDDQIASNSPDSNSGAVFGAGSGGALSARHGAASGGSSGNSLGHGSGGVAKASAVSRESIREAEMRFTTAYREAESSIRRFDQLVNSMSDACRDMPPSSTAVKHTERFLGIVMEKKRALQRITGDFKRRKERLELIPNVTRDIDQYEEQAGVRLLMEEQDAIRHTQARVNNILESAAGTHDRLRSQRERFNSIGDRLVQIAERVPVIHDVLNRIDSRRRREVVVLGAVVGFCLLITFVFW